MSCAKAESDRQLAQKMISILSQTLDQVKPVCKQIAEVSFLLFGRGSFLFLRLGLRLGDVLKQGAFADLVT
jgi:hypothetical protein